MQKNYSPLTLLPIIPPTSTAIYGTDPLMGQQPIIFPDVSEFQQIAATDFLEELSREFESSSEVFLFTKVGTIRDEILNTAKEWSSDIIILGNNGRTG